MNKICPLVNGKCMGEKCYGFKMEQSTLSWHMERKCRLFDVLLEYDMIKEEK